MLQVSQVILQMCVSTLPADMDFTHCVFFFFSSLFFWKMNCAAKIRILHKRTIIRFQEFDWKVLGLCFDL